MPMAPRATLAVPEVGQCADGVLSPDEFVDVPLVNCLKIRAQFEFFVDVSGTVHEEMS
jgi:hypothetical protein